MDILTPLKRSERMSLIRAKDTKPELTVRRLIHSMGFRYRLHSNNLPGKPDLVFTRQKKAIFVHGCFWHLHDYCKKARLPKSNLDYWYPKLTGNKTRDLLNQTKLESLGWKILVVWECEVNDLIKLTSKLINFLCNNSFTIDHRTKR